ncbi:MAG: hypothetical protein V7L29_10675 [Nostoc sp.]|uniref:hypothetical protein n=1 Tax=Nostoc sp. TaxID=1180 RepID=UPI002FF6CF54
MDQTLSRQFFRCRDSIYLNSISIFQNGIQPTFAEYLIIILYLLAIILILSEQPEIRTRQSIDTIPYRDKQLLFMCNLQLYTAEINVVV